MKRYLRWLMLLPTISFGQGLDAVQRDIEKTLKSVDGTFAVAFESLDGQGHLLLNEKMMFHAASTMKTPVMIEVYRQSKERRFSLDDSLVVKNEFRSIVDGSSYQLDLKDDSDDSMYEKLGAKSSIRALLRQMITVSSNLATNLLMDLVGANRVTATMRSLGASDIEVLRGVEDGKAFEKGLNNRTSAFDLLVIMKAISQGKAVDSAASKEMIEILVDQKFNELIPALLPPAVRVAHKTGNITGVEHDSGIVMLPDGRRYVLVILSKDLKDVDAGKKAIALVSRRIYDLMTEGK
ncbi:MAG: class A beta-lactamase-related serine hydrolase [Ignavibacteriales bacterium]|nr:class A beta-lactamase-related serine hydrolase [Ignavibacteriales bacterium]